MKQGTAELILKKLSDGIEKAFPETPDTTLEVKYVPKEMEEHLSPAFYMIPAIDNSRENVIYINQGRCGMICRSSQRLPMKGIRGIYIRQSFMKVQILIQSEVFSILAVMWRDGQLMRKCVVII